MNKILVVDDEQSVIDVLKACLEGAGYEVSSAKTGQRGLELALTGKFDLIILDIMLPDKDGRVICNKIRKNMDTMLTPIIMLSAKEHTIDRMVGMESGADDYMVKPFDIKEVVAKVNAILKKTP